MLDLLALSQHGAGHVAERDAAPSTWYAELLQDQLPFAALLLLTSACSSSERAQFHELPEPPPGAATAFLAVQNGLDQQVLVGPANNPPRALVGFEDELVFELIYVDEPLEALGLDPGRVQPASGLDPLGIPEAISSHVLNLNDPKSPMWTTTEAPSDRLSTFEFDGPPCVGLELEAVIPLPTDSTNAIDAITVDEDGVLVLVARGSDPERSNAFVLHAGDVIPVPSLAGSRATYVSAARIEDGELWVASQAQLLRLSVSSTVSVELITQLPEDAPPVPEALEAKNSGAADAILGVAAGPLPDGTVEAFVLTRWNFFRYLEATDTWEHISTNAGNDVGEVGVARLGPGRGLAMFKGSSSVEQYDQGRFEREPIPSGAEPTTTLDHVPGFGVLVATAAGAVLRSASGTGDWEREAFLDGGRIESFVRYDDGFLVGFEGAFTVGRYRRGRGYCTPQALAIEQAPSRLAVFGDRVAAAANNSSKVSSVPIEVMILRPSED